MTRRLSCFDAFLVPVLVSALFLLSQPTAAQKNPNPGSRSNSDVGMPMSHSYSVGGSIADADTHNRIDNVRVDLRVFAGGTVATVFTSGNGNFMFNNVAAGNYQLVVDQVGYQPFAQQVDVEGPLYGLAIELRSKPLTGSVNAKAGTISQRDL